MAQRPIESRGCPTCGAANARYATFCLECGDPLTDAAAPGMGSGGRETAPGRPILLRWELWLGLVLVLGVGLFALGDWWRQEGQAQDYRSGLIAANDRHWDAAAATFARLGDYRDAADRQRVAAANVRQRDAAYQAGQAAAARQDWVAAFRALGQAFTIEPDYRDTRALYQQAGQAVTAATLAHTIYRRVQGSTPGLYLPVAGAAPRLLPGSDAQSQVWANNSTGTLVVYDGPTGTPAPAPTPGPPGGRRGQVRGMTLAADRHWLALDLTKVAALPRALPRLDGLVQALVLGPSGVWVSSRNANNNGLHFRLGDIQGFPLNQLLYYSFASGQTTPADANAGYYQLLPASTGRPLDRLVLARYEQPGPTTQLYLVSPDSAAPLPIIHLPGTVYAADLSADGHYLLCTVGTTEPASPRLDLVLLDLRDPEGSSQVIASLISLQGSGTLQGAFVPGADPPQMLIRRVVGGTTQLSVRGLVDGTTRNLWRGAQAPGAPNTAFADALWFSPDGRWVGFTPQAGQTAFQLVLLPLAVPGSAATFPLPGKRAGYWLPLFPATTQGTAYQVYLGERVQTGAQNRGPQLEVYSVAQAHPDQAPLLLLQRPPPAGSSLNLGVTASGLLVYGAGTDLRLRPLDGGPDYLAVPGADMFWALQGTGMPKFMQPLNAGP